MSEKSFYFWVDLPINIEAPGSKTCRQAPAESPRGIAPLLRCNILKPGRFYFGHVWFLIEEIWKPEAYGRDLEGKSFGLVRQMRRSQQHLRQLLYPNVLRCFNSV